MRLALLVVLVVFGIGAPTLAQGPPYGPKEVIPASQQRRLAAMLHVVSQAERVEALPVQTAGTGLSSTSRVVERNTFLRAAKKAFPKQFDAFHEENPDVKSIGF